MFIAFILSIQSWDSNELCWLFSEHRFSDIIINYPLGRADASFFPQNLFIAHSRNETRLPVIGGDQIITYLHFGTTGAC